MGGNDAIIIVGGGLGGLTAALALARRGIAVRVLEGAPEFGAIGYGIQFGPNVFHVFDRLGLSAAVLDKADTPSGVLLIDALNGREVTRVPTGCPSFRERFKYPYIIIHRIDLHNVLLDACRCDPLVTLVPNAQVTQSEESGDGVAVRTEDDRSFTGAALIAADGIRSRMRAQMFGDGDPLPNGFMAFRTIVPMADVTCDVARDIVALWGGPGFHMVHYPLRHGTLFNIVAVFRRSASFERGDAATYRAELEHTYRNAHPTMKSLLAMLDLSRRQAVGDRDPIRYWHKGRTVLLGDAAHPTLQSLAQGACMAIEDGLCLADCIAAANGDYQAAFRRYESARSVRTARVTLESRSIWDVYHSDGIAREVYWQTLGERSETETFQCLAWLYDGFRLPEEDGRAAHG
ncbi:MAG TPA: FAD-dependent monooxygenase [Xanthobacteraceae bacterium]|nr:FAD-dependent monooxygenase [Xanthobacteraceae bacterium]